jgi:hypothetical protein
MIYIFSPDFDLNIEFLQLIACVKTTDQQGSFSVPTYLGLYHHGNPIHDAGRPGFRHVGNGVYHAHPKHVDPNLSDPAHMLPENVVPNSRSRIAVRGYGGKDVLIPYISIGTWAWGDKATYNYDATVDLPRIHAAWEKLKSVGLTFVDTAQSWGNVRVSGSAEPCSRECLEMRSSYRQSGSRAVCLIL